MVDFPTILASALISLLVSVGVTEYRLSRTQSYEEQQEIDDWYSETAQITSNTQSMWRQKFTRGLEQGGSIPFEEIQRKAKLTASQIRTHIGAAGALEVDEEVVNSLEETAEACESLAEIMIHMNVTDEFREQGEEVVQQAGETEELALDHLQS